MHLRSILKDMMKRNAAFQRRLKNSEGNIRDTSEKIDKSHIGLIICLHGFHLAV